MSYLGQVPEALFPFPCRPRFRQALVREASKLRNGALARDFLAIHASWWRPSHDDNGSRSILPRNLLRDALAREAPKHRNGALARDFLANYSSWCLARGRVSSLDGHGGVVRIQSTECFSQELV